MNTHKLCITCSILLLSSLTLLNAAEELRYEAEEWTEPKSAWLIDKSTQDHWNLWSTDKDAEKKWSGGGIVLQSPVVKEDRKTPDDGAPPLHTKITGIPDGIYDIEIKSGRTLGISLNGTDWKPYRGGTLLENHKIKNGTLELWVDDRYETKGNNGANYYDCVILTPTPIVIPKPKVNGSAKTRVIEKINRGLVAIPTPDGVYLGWRLLKDDPQNISFDLYRQEGDNPRLKINSKPISLTTDFIDKTAPSKIPLTYSINPTGSSIDPSNTARTCRSEDSNSYIEIKLDNVDSFQKCGIGDLDGNGSYDYVIKQPGSNIDPWHKYWHASPGTYKLEAYSNDGKRLWSYDMGWGIEQGIWYSPYIVYDLNGDGKAEVALKTGEGDPRDKDGKVTQGAEWLMVLDGATGMEITRVPWPDRTGFGDADKGYNYSSRNQLAIAFLDGKTPCLLALRGTYNTMKAEAYELADNKLKFLWKYSDSEGGKKYRGQGCHFTHSVDIDNDGRDEVILGSAVLDDNGSPLWSTGLGHPDNSYVGDINPKRPGLEIFYGIETARDANTMCLVDAKSGEIIWGWDKHTDHIHSIGMCSDIDPASPGSESYGADSKDHKPTGDRWLWSANGKIISRDTDFGFGIRTAYWDADLQREIMQGSGVKDFNSPHNIYGAKGSVVLVADIIGDWREEIIVSVKDGLRIYTTTIPAFDRRPSLMQDPIYRLDVAMCAMGYWLVPMTSYALDAVSPNLNLTVINKNISSIEIVASAPLTSGLKGTLNVSINGKLLEQATMEVHLKPGELVKKTIELAHEALPKGEILIESSLKQGNTSMCTSWRGEAE